MKHNYSKPECEILDLTKTDVICTSGDYGDGYESGDDGVNTDQIG